MTVTYCKKFILITSDFKSWALLDTKYSHELWCEIIAFLYLLHGASYTVPFTLTELCVWLHRWCNTFGIPLVARIVTTVPNALFFYFQCSEDVTQLRYVEDIQPNTVHMAWQIPQYFLLTCGEVVFSVTGLEFSYSQVGFALQLIHVLAQNS